MSKNDFLITTTVAGKTWPEMWDQEDELELDYPVFWKVSRENGEVLIKHATRGDAYRLTPEQLAGHEEIALPQYDGEDRQINVHFRPVKRIRPAFLTNEEAARSVGPSEHYISAGIREHLIAFKEFPEKVFHGMVTDQLVFDLQPQGQGKHKVVAKVAGLRFKPFGAESKALMPGAAVPFTEKELLTGAFIYGSYWWRVNKVPTPQMVDLDELDTELKSQDLVSLQSLTKGLGGAFIILLLALRGYFYVSNMHNEKKPVVAAEVELKKPKLIEVAKATPTPKPPEPKKEVAKKEPPKKPEPKKPEPKVAKKEPPKPKKPEPPKVAKKEPPPIPTKPQPPKPTPKVASAPPPVKNAPKAPVAKAPDPSVVAAAEKASVAKSLNFLSTGPSKTVTALATNPNAKYSEKYAAAGSGAMPGTTSALSKMANANTGDGPISTRGARSIASNSGIAGGHGKGLNEVQGKVSMNALYGSGSGDALGAAAGGGGMSVSGPGKLSDAEIEKTLAKYVDKFQRCYEKALLSDSSLAGEVSIGWTINPNGSVAGAHIVRSEMNKKPLHDCLTGEMSKIMFPTPKGGSVAVKKAFRFKSSSI